MAPISDFDVILSRWRIGLYTTDTDFHDGGDQLFVMDQICSDMFSNGSYASFLQVELGHFFGIFIQVFNHHFL